VQHFVSGSTATSLCPLITRTGTEMVECDLDTSVVDWVIEHPVTVSVFEQLGMDYCCGGISLDYACTKQGLDAHLVLSMLRNLLEQQRERVRDLE
jgi:regulator of cell morphogenesis and NO signaling